MMEAKYTATAATRTTPARRTGPWRAPSRLLLRAGLVGLGILGCALWAIAWYREAPKVEPPFERIVGPVAGPVTVFALRDLDGGMHTSAEWAGHRAIVLFTISPECPISQAYLPELARLAREYGPRGIAFFGIDSGAAASSGSSPWRTSGWDLPFPILLDPTQTVARQADLRVTPEAVVLLPDGQVLYRGRIDDRSAETQGSQEPRAHELKDALDAILADELPVVTTTIALGTRLIPSSPSADSVETITFNKHVAPILWKNCAKCHRPGEVGPFSLLTYRDAAKRASFIREVTEAGQMPPWKARPGRRGVHRRPTSVRDREGDPRPMGRDRLRARRPGRPASAAEVLRQLVARPARPGADDARAPGACAEGDDLYRAFAIPFPLDRDVTIRGIEFRPGDRRIVHHSRIHLDTTGDARRRDRTDPGPGFSAWVRKVSFELPYPGLGGWTPGLTPRFAPEGAGRVIPRDSDIVFQIHYHRSGKVERDQSSVGLYFAEGPVTRKLTGLTLSTDRIDIPAGAKRHTIIQSARLRTDVHLYTVVPHAHYLCREFRLAATLPDGRCQPLLWIEDWNIDWQDQYRFAMPVRLPKGTIVTLAAYFDNSEDNPRNPNKPPQRVRYGVGTKDEMCACHLEILPDDPSGYDAYPNKSPFGL